MQSHESANVLQLHSEHGLEAMARRPTAKSDLDGKGQLSLDWVGTPFAIAPTLNPQAKR